MGQEFEAEGFASATARRPRRGTRRYWPRCPQVSGAAAFNREDIE